MTARESRAADRGAPAAATPISLPKGGGAFRGIGEKFGTSPVTGTGTLSIPIACSPGRDGFQPQLALAYDSGAGNGPFGFGWTLHLPAITRRTDQGLPRYDDEAESDVFVLAGAEDLVPLLDAGGARFADDTIAPGYRVHRYRPRIEGLFARIERWTRAVDGDVHWRSISRENVLTVYGKDPDSRVADPADGRRIFSWLVCETRDDRGNAIVFDYVSEDGARAPLDQPHERNRGPADDSRPTANRYLKRVRYANRTPLLDADGNRPALLTGKIVGATQWMVDVVLDYDEGHLESVPPQPGLTEREQHRRVRASSQPTRRWATRPDPFSTYRPGFEVRTARRCRRVMVFHHVPDASVAQPGYDGLVSATDFDYNDIELTPAPAVAAELAHEGSTRYASFLQSATQSGYRRDGDAELEQSLPPLTLRYSRATVQDDVRELPPRSLDDLPSGLAGGRRLVDLDGEGVAGVLADEAGWWYYKPNLGDGVFGPLEPVAARPTTAAGEAPLLLDLAGDGRLALVRLAGPLAGYHERTPDAGWEPLRPFDQLPALNWDDPNLRFIDLDGDGRPDALITEQDALTWHQSLGEQGFGMERRVATELDEERAPRVMFSDLTQSIYAADMSGDGLSDLVRVRNGDVCYWPNLGHGRFGSKVTLDGAPWFDAPDVFDQRRVRLADIDGSGTTDLIYLAADGVRLYFNRAGNSLSEARPLAPLPHVGDLSSILVADLLGTGTACLVWSSPLPADAGAPLRYIDLMGSTKPHLLVGTVNNMGAETQIDYAPSTRFSLADKAAGRPWVTRLPFCVHVVERITVFDRVSGNRQTSRYAYHHGYFDGAEREFRGFGMVEQWDTEAFAALDASGHLPPATNLDAASHVPPVHTKTWFHTGWSSDREHISDSFAGLLGDTDTDAHYYREPGLTDDQVRALLLEDTVIPAGLTVEEEREACRALKGNVLRREVYALDGTPHEAHPYSVSEQNAAIQLLQPRAGNRHAVFLVHPRESLSTHYERAPADPRVSHALTLEVDDRGNVLRSADVVYGRVSADPELAPEDQAAQARMHVTAAEHRVTNAVADAANHREPLPWESRTFELAGLPDLPPRGRFVLEDLDVAIAAAPVISFEEVPHGATVQKRLLDRRRIAFRRDDLGGPAPFGTLETRGLVHERYSLALTRALVTAIYGARLDTARLDGDGRYVHPDGDPEFWVASGREFLSPGPADTPQQELAYARAHFFHPLRHRDPFHTAELSTEAVVTYDSHDLLVAESRDALGNVTRADRHDYRVLQASLVVDPNGNRGEVVYDALGVVAGSAAMGKAPPAPAEGDTLAEFVPDLTAAQIDALLADPGGPLAATLLAGATTRTIVDRDAFRRDGAPSVGVTVSREVHAADLVAGAVSPLHVSLAYFDGLGRQIQIKAQARPGPVPLRDASGAVITGPDGEPELTPGDVAPRWVVSGWTIFDNKGKPVRSYQPFFSDTHAFEFDVRIGVSSITFYDPLGRVVGVLHPDHTWEKVVLGAWRSERWDLNDTVSLVPAADDDLGGFFERLPARDHSPTWSALRLDPALAAAHWPDEDERAAQRRAAEQAAVHASTPTTEHTDAFGRTILTVVLNRFKSSDSPAGDPPVEQRLLNRTVMDAQGNTRAVIDGRGRTVASYEVDLRGQRILERSMDAGSRWSLTDVAGSPLLAWDDRGHTYRTLYDALRRPTDLLLRDGAGPERLVGQTVYGESRPDAQASNLRGRVVEVRDQAGLATTDAYDFSGGLLHNERRLATLHTGTLDWAGAVDLQDERFTSTTRYDALGRAIQQVAPHSDRPGTAVKVLQPTFDDGGRLVAIDVWLDLPAPPAALLAPATADLHAIADVHYDALGRRIRLDRGNGAVTEFRYDPRSQRLVGQLTRRGAADFPDDCPAVPPIDWPGCQIQNLGFVHDPVGNVMTVRDRAQQAVFFRNKRVAPGNEYVYDARYRLIEATGREHIGQAAAPVPHSYRDATRSRLAHPSDGNAMARYVERYAYDEVGNLQSMRHRGADPAAQGWSRDYTYAEASLLEPAQHGNRLTSTVVGAASEVYSAGGDGYDAHGNMLRLPQLQAVAWDFADRLRMTSRQAVDADDADGAIHAGERTFYVYGAGGERVRKVTEKPGGGVREERIQLGGFEILRRGGASPLVVETLLVVADGGCIALVDSTVEGGADDTPEHLVRHQFTDHLGSAAMELDDRARIISYEEYTAYGSTAYQAVRSQTETPKRYRYTGVERDDETGLQYHGARYYAPWLGRWLSCDPIGIGGGTCLYAYCRGNPTSRTDTGGMQDEPTMTGGITITSGGGVTFAPIIIPPSRDPSKYVVAFGRAGGYMERAETNTGLTPINIQDMYNLRRGNGTPFPGGQVLEYGHTYSSDRPGGLYPMFSGHMTQDALEGRAAGTVHFDMRNVTLTPDLPSRDSALPLENSSPGFAPTDFHSSSEARQVIAHLASTEPGERKVDIYIQHEDGISIIRKGSNVVEGAPLPKRLADHTPNLTNTGSRGGTATTPGGTPGGTARRGGSTAGGTGGIPAGQVVTGTLGTIGRAIPGVAEAEAALLGTAGLAAAYAPTAVLAGPLIAAAEIVPVAAGIGVVGAVGGNLVRAGALAVGASKTEANTIGFLAAVGIGAALGSFIPVVGTAIGAAIGAAVAGIAYLWSIW